MNDQLRLTGLSQRSRSHDTRPKIDLDAWRLDPSDHQSSRFSTSGLVLVFINFLLMFCAAANSAHDTYLHTVSYPIVYRPVAKGIESNTPHPPALKRHFSANCSSANILNIVRL